MIYATAQRNLKHWVLLLALFGLLAAQFAGCAAVQESPEEPVQPAPPVVQEEPAPPPAPPSPPPPPTPTKIVAIVTAHTLNVRQGPSTSNKIIGVVKKDDQVEIRDFSGNWYRIHTPSIEDGWVSGKFLTGFMEINPASGATMPQSTAPVPQPIIEEASPPVAHEKQILESETIEEALSQ